MKIEFITNDTQCSSGNTVLVSIDSYYWHRNLCCWVPIVMYRRDHAKSIDEWRATLRRFNVATMFVKRRA
jgi:hypothetical protein